MCVALNVFLSIMMIGTNKEIDQINLINVGVKYRMDKWINLNKTGKTCLIK